MPSTGAARSRSGSIHDLNNAPEAPEVLSLTLSSQRDSPKSSSRSTLSLLSDAATSSLSLRFDPEAEHLDAPNRRRLDSAPGRLNYISESGEHSGSDVDVVDLRDRSDPNDHTDLTSVPPEFHHRMRSNRTLPESDHVRGSSRSLVDHDVFLDQGHDDFTVPDGMDDSEFYAESPPPRAPQTSTKGLFAGFKLPMSQYYEGCGITRVTACLVRHAPCFWFCGNPLDVGATDRSILYRLNILCAFFALGQVAAGCFLLVVLNSNLIADRYNSAVVRNEDSTSFSLDLWNLNGSVFCIAMVGLIILVTVLCTLRIVREVNLRGAVRYLWTMLWLLPLQIFFVISLFDYHRVTQVWVRHWWYLPSMAWFRKEFCINGTYQTLCVVPIDGGQNFTSEEQWCADIFNATNCTEIRDLAQNEATGFMYVFYYCCGVWGIFLIILLFLAIRFLEAIITKDIVQTSRESNVPGWMLLPIIGCITVGSVFLFSPSSVISGSSESTNSQWVGILYIVGGCCFFISALLGWFIGQFNILNSQDKRNKNLAVICFIAINVIITLLLAGVFAGSVLLSTNLVDVPLSEANRGRGACAIDTAQSCSYCGNRVGIPECPEWTEDDVIKVLLTQYKSSATFAAIFILYAISAMRFGIILKRHISMYQIDYV